MTDSRTSKFNGSKKAKRKPKPVAYRPCKRISGAAYLRLKAKEGGV